MTSMAKAVALFLTSEKSWGACLEGRGYSVK